MPVRWTVPARQDLIEAFNYIKQDNPPAAESVLDRIINLTDQLDKHPKMGREGRLPMTRELIIPNTPFFIVYRMAGSEVHILSLIHGSRDWP